MRDAIERRWPLLLLIWCGFPTPAQPQTTAPPEEFVISLPDAFDYFCPSNPIPPIPVTIGETLTFDVSITAQQDLTLRTAVLLPGAVAATFDDIGATLDPPFPSDVVEAKSEVTSTFEWTPTERRPGTYLFRFLATGTEGLTRFTACEVPVEVGDLAMGCLLTGAADPDDDDTEIDFGTVLPGATATKEARLEFFPTADQMIGEDEIFVCPSDDSRFGDGGIRAVNGNDAFVRLTFSPTRPGRAQTTVGFYHAADVAADDPCDPEQNKCLQTLDLTGLSARADIAVEFTDFACGDPTTVSAVLRNESNFDIVDLSLEADSGFRVRPSGFSARKFSLGGTESEDLAQEREFRVEFPQDPAEQTEKSLRVSQGELTIVDQRITVPPCIVVEPLMIDFGELTVGSPASTQTITLINPSEQDLVVTATLEPDDQGFQLSESAVAVVGGSTKDIEVDFLPASAGPKSAVIEFGSSSGGAVFPVSLEGLALPATAVELSFLSGELSLSPGTTFELPSTTVGTDTSSAFRIVNEGNVVAEDLVAATREGEFEISPTEPLALLPGESIDYVVTFSPQQSGVKQGVLVVSGANLPDYTFFLSGEASLEPVQLQAWGLEESVLPRQLDPYPSVGLRLSEPATELLEGALQIGFEGSPLPPDPSVLFLETGSTVSFRFLPGRTQAVFPNEPDEELVRYQSGTVAGTIWFEVTSLQTRSGTSVSIVEGPQAGSTKVLPLEPRIIDGTCARTEHGVTVTLKAFSTIRQINGVDIALSPAPGTELAFTKPPEDFANSLFTSWFSSPESAAFGGAFALAMPISITDIRSLGSISLRLKNEMDWSPSVQISGNSCLR